MKNKLVFRILGAIASALIIVSVFVPFVSVTGFSQSLWEAHESVGTLYLPIMIIVFGAIGVIFFSINIKTELAYTSSGALLFFLIMQTIPIIDQGTFNTLSVGYYCLVVGTVLTGIMAFLCNLRTKNRVIEQPVETPKPISVLNQIDKLYDNQVSSTNELQNNDLNNIIQPLPTQDNSLNNINSIPIQNNIVEPQTISQQSVDANPIPSPISGNPVSLQSLNNEVPQPSVVQPSVVQPVVEQTSNVVANPVVSEFEIPIQNVNDQQSNPVLSEFSNQQSNVQTVQPVEQNIPVEQSTPVQSNPVVAQFDNSQPTMQQTPIVSQPQTPMVEPLQPLNNQSQISEPKTDNNSNLDIFG